MTWVKLGDEFAAAAEGLSDGAHRLHVDALAWSARHLLDLVVPRKHLPRFAYCADPAAAAAELVDAGWWEEAGDDWYIGVRWAEWQRTSADVLAERADAAQRQDRSRRHRKGDHSRCSPKRCAQASRVTDAVTSPVTDAVSHAHPDPTRPGPKEPVSGRVHKNGHGVTHGVTVNGKAPALGVPSIDDADGYTAAGSYFAALPEDIRKGWLADAEQALTLEPDGIDVDYRDAAAYVRRGAERAIERRAAKSAYAARPEEAAS